MNTIVCRTCTEIPLRDANGTLSREDVSRPLEEYRSAPAYVLLGDPGAGKTTALRAECEALGSDVAHWTSARDFITLNVDRHPEWRGKTLFIDGLDEIRAGATDGRTPFDRVRERLDNLGRPRFRLSCRDVDWLGNSDRMRLASVSEDSQVTVLRLDPLTDSDVAHILNAHTGIGDARAFMEKARQQGVDGLLTNPQTLEMLADVVGGRREWPDSRKQTYEMACRQMVREHNEEHQAARAANSSPGPDQLFDAAGRLCAVQLLSGNAGHSLRHNEADEDYPALDECDSDSPKMLRAALATQLFKGAANNRFIPIHRHIAEFLGARHLSKVIGDGLPAQRVFALMTGEDGTVVTEMRGLSAWLAAHCSNARADLIKRDPIGVGLYGDIREFSPDEKRALLKALNREGSFRIDSSWGTASAFGALAIPDLEPVLREILSDSNRDQDHQMFTDFVLRVLNQGAPLPNLSEILLEIVRDDTWWPRLNSSALDAFIHNCPKGVEKTRKLKTLLADIQTENVSDPDNELLGTLLDQLYPQELPPSKVWDHMSERGNLELAGGSFQRFWDTGLVETSSDEQVAELLDHLQQRLPGLKSALEGHQLNGLPVNVLARGLKVHGDRLDTGRLYDWLSVGLLWDRAPEASWYGNESIRNIRSWLEQRPDVQKKVIIEGLDRCPETGAFRPHAFDVQKRLYGAAPPPDFGLWCLNQAVHIADTKPQASEHLLERAVRAHQHRSNNEGLSVEVLKERTKDCKALQNALSVLLAPPRFEERRRREMQSYREEREIEQKRWLDHVRSNEAALRENRATPALLYQLAKQYFGFPFGTDDGPKAIGKRLRGDQSLVRAALQGLRGVINREDVPELEKILSLQETGRMHYLGWPFLAGLAEVERTAPEDASQWDDDRIRKAIAFYYCTPHAGYQPQWYRRLLEARPRIVADVQVRFAVSEFRRDRDSIYKLWELAHDTHHAQVARYASLPLLYAFPTRCTLKQIRALDHLLWAALQHADRASFREVIGRKLSRTSMNVAQRAHWLAAGCAASPEGYRDHLEDFVQAGRDERRIRHVATFFCPDDRVQFSFEELGIPVLELLIRLVGNYASPDEWSGGSGWVTPVMRASGFVRELIRRLAALPDQLASDALDTLHNDAALSPWRDVISQAQDAQRVIRRDAVHNHPDREQVCRTLNNSVPANAADLAALVIDRLHEIANQVRTGNTDDWRQYWNEDADKQRWKPKNEDACRDAILSDLRQRQLPQGVDAQPEGQYANDKRADIRISCLDFQVPVEVKKNKHRDLWSACKNQLIKQYTTDPATSGYGIYLVFWFGKDFTQPPSSFARPDSPQKLQEQLKATLSEDDARKISVCVIDVSKAR